MSSAPDALSTPDPSRLVTYRWMCGACRRNSSVNCSGLVREHPIRSASLRGICRLSGGIGVLRVVVVATLHCPQRGGKFPYYSGLFLVPAFFRYSSSGNRPDRSRAAIVSTFARG